MQRVAHSFSKANLDRYKLAQARRPVALGPFLGRLAAEANVGVVIVAGVLGADETTVGRWFIGTSTIRFPHLRKVLQLIAILAWIHKNKPVPLVGTTATRSALLIKYTKEFIQLEREHRCLT